MSSEVVREGFGEGDREREGGVGGVKFGIETGYGGYSTATTSTPFSCLLILVYYFC